MEGLTIKVIEVNEKKRRSKLPTCKREKNFMECGTEGVMKTWDQTEDGETEWVEIVQVPEYLT